MVRHGAITGLYSRYGLRYITNNLGLPLTLFLLGLFTMHPARTEAAVSMKAMISLYFATSLCIGASVFTIKTSALLWFLYGTTNSVVTPTDALVATTDMVERVKSLRPGRLSTLPEHNA